MSRLAFSYFFGGIVLFAAASMPAVAQTTIFNVPVADTQPRGSWGLEIDLLVKPVSYKAGGYQTYGYRLAYGLSNKTEVGSNFYYTRDGGDRTGQAEFSVKQKVYENEALGRKVTGGAVLFVPLRSLRGDKTHAIVYAEAGKTINQLHGLTVTGGIYHILGGRRNFGTKTGAIVGVVQPVYRRFSFVADWYSGNNRFGYSSAGVNFAITKRQYLTTGYSFGNYGRGNNNLAAFYGITF